MALYKYKAKDKEGNIYERTIEVKNRLDIYNVIREEGGRVISIREVGNQSVLLFWDSIFSKSDFLVRADVTKNAVPKKQYRLISDFSDRNHSAALLTNNVIYI